ncbi:MAG TPA: hypothetical protein DCL21_00200 [Alphaproteobacteria bacterium]|nr:hypothetical protein [Alphaproteobacteria bacterium]
MFQEKVLKNIEVSDNFHINGVLLTKESNSSLIICCHGLGGNGNNHMNLKTRDYVVENNLNYDVFRFDFYKEADNHRSFLNTTVESQINDLGKVIDFFSIKYDNIYIMATSYGALTSAVLNSNKVTKQALIDPSFIIDVPWAQSNSSVMVDADGNKFNVSFDRTVPFLFNEDMKQEGLAWSPIKSQEHIDNINVDTLIVQANSPYYQLSRSLNFANENIETYYMEHADHNFTKLNSMNIMLKKVFMYFN